MNVTGAKMGVAASASCLAQLRKIALPADSDVDGEKWGRPGMASHPKGAAAAGEFIFPGKEFQPRP
jgi:hypothetical protein